LNSNPIRLFITPEELIQACDQVGLKANQSDFRGLSPEIGLPPFENGDWRPEIKGIYESNFLLGSYIGYAIKI
jgi:hypothetical protein